MKIAYTMRATCHILDPFNVDDECDYRDFDREDLDENDFCAKARNTIFNSDFCKPFLLDLRRVKNTNQTALAQMSDCKDKLESLLDNPSKRSYVLESIDNLSRWRRESRAGNAVIVTSVFAKVVEDYAAEIGNCEFCGSGLTESEWFAYADRAEVFFRKVLEVGKLPERAPEWQRCLGDVIAVKPHLTSKMSVGKLNGKLETYNVQETLADAGKLADLLQVLTVAVSATAADDLKELEDPATNMLKETVIFLMGRLSFLGTPLLEEGINVAEKLVEFLPQSTGVPYKEVAAHPLFRGVLALAGAGGILSRAGWGVRGCRLHLSGCTCVRGCRLHVSSLVIIRSP